MPDDWPDRVRHQLQLNSTDSAIPCSIPSPSIPSTFLHDQTQAYCFTNRLHARIESQHPDLTPACQDLDGTQSKQGTPVHAPQDFCSYIDTSETKQSLCWHPISAFSSVGKFCGPSISNLARLLAQAKRASTTNLLQNVSTSLKKILDYVPLRSSQP